MVPHIPHGAHAAAKRQQEIIGAFRRTNATSAGGAKTLAELGLKEDQALQRMQRAEVVRALPGGRYYLDEDRLKDVKAQQARYGLIFAFIVLLIIVIVLALRA